ncbi:hypothetical protein CDIK_3871 [Cucumispora dikerogammari]|nr:hypothetical protein CDIK_3871 [Cucumispora dikerogammari]
MRTESVFSVNLKITELNLNLLSLCGGLVRCIEDITRNNSENDYKIEFDTESNGNCFDYNCNVRKENNLSFRENKAYTKCWQNNIKYQKNYVDPRESCNLIGRRVKSESITQFRKKLGIKEDKIKTTLFKFIFYLCFGDRDNNKEYIKINVETMPFRFNKNADGILVLEKEVESQRCRVFQTQNT